jgi:light-regulated signal transduction histidine kinase (bacteriophytochrome)
MTKSDQLRLELVETQARHKDEVRRIRADRKKTYREQDFLIAELEERLPERVDALRAAVPLAEREEARELKRRADEVYERRYAQDPRYRNI